MLSIHLSKKKKPKNLLLINKWFAFNHTQCYGRSWKISSNSLILSNDPLLLIFSPIIPILFSAVNPPNSPVATTVAPHLWLYWAHQLLETTWRFPGALSHYWIRLVEWLGVSSGLSRPSVSCGRGLDLERHVGSGCASQCCEFSGARNSGCPTLHRCVSRLSVTVKKKSLTRANHEEMGLI